MSPAKFFFRVMGFAGIVLLVIGLCAWFGPNASRIDYHGALAAKHHRLHELGSPKVILIGGSNATFGIDSELLQEDLCIPVVNMSLHASLGFKFMVDEVIDEIGKGDLVIVALEHSAYHEPERDNDTHILVADRYPEALAFMPWYVRPKVLLGVLVMRTQAVYKVWTGAWKDHSLDKVYRADGFNEQGDLVSHLGLPQRDPGSQERVEYKDPVFSPEFWPIAQALLDRAETENARVLFTWPAVASSSFNEERSDTITVKMKQHGVDMLGKAKDFVQADSAFYDTHYHLRAAGRRSRTVQLIKDLCGSGAVECCAGGSK